MTHAHQPRSAKYCAVCGEIEQMHPAIRPTTKESAIAPAPPAFDELMGAEEANERTIKNFSPVRFEPTPAGFQAVIAETPARTVPAGPLKPKCKQKEGLTLLELYEEIIREPKLF